jgi:hypothetical protein
MSDEGPTQFDRAFLQGMDVTVLCIRMVEWEYKYNCLGFVNNIKKRVRDGKKKRASI